MALNDAMSFSKLTLKLEMNDTEGSSVIADTFSQLLKRLSKLRALDLEFPAQFTEDDYSPRSGDFQSPALQFQWAVLDSLGQSASSPSLSHISLRNVTPWSVYSARQFTLPNILRHITHFSLTVKSSDTSQHYTCPSLDHAAFWDPLDFLVALNPDNVVSICLENDFAGISIEIPKEIRFPLLTHLKMDGFCFWSKGTLSDFIVRHGGSLESLDLDGRYVFVDEKGHRTWADLYQVFQGCLKNLQSFSTTFGSTGYLRMDAMDLSHYDAFDDELDSTTLEEDEILDDEESYAFIHQRDKQALRLFLQAIDAQRASLINEADR